MKKVKIYTGYLRITIILCVVLLIISFFNFNVQVNVKEHSSRYISESLASIANDTNSPKSTNGNVGFPETVEQIMERGKDLPLDNIPLKQREEEKEKYPDRRNLPQNPLSPNESSYPPVDKKYHDSTLPLNPQTVSTNFNAISLSETGFIPADNMGAAGPTQIIVMANGRIKSFNKTTGTADGIINSTTDNFFNSVRNGSGTSDPRIRYDRLSQRWFIVIINVSSPNRILISVSNTPTITGATIWTFFFINAPSEFIDYPTLGIDNNALYIGTNNFNTALTAFLQTTGYVIRKSDLLAGTLTSTFFPGLAVGTGVGPLTPQGVDNFDVSSTEGYFIGVDNATFGTLMMRRVSNPGGSPSISGNISITVNTTTYPNPVRHLGANINRRLDALDDRLFAACIRNGRLWTAHNFDVNTSGVASYGSGRVGTRWYELQNLSSTPGIVQSGTIFDPTAVSPISYWIPTVMVSGQGHAAFIFSSAGINNRVNESTNGRLSGGTLGTTQAVTNVTSSSTAYNVEAVDGQRWGDYSYVSLDPDDDMTMWGVMGYCDGTNSYGVRVAKLLAPPPPPLSSASPPSIILGQSNVNVTITGTPSTGEGFYDPGAGFLNRISATISGGVVVNSVTYNSATQVTLNITTTSAVAGTKTVTVTNPDGQFVSSSVIFDTPLPVVLSSFTSEVNSRNVKLNWVTELEINNRGFDIERQYTDVNGKRTDWSFVSFVQGKGTVNKPNEYTFTDIRLNTGKYNYRLKQLDYNGNYERFNLNNDVLIGIPNQNELSQNYPNPFNPKTNIDYSVSLNGNVSIIVYDITGREVKQIVNEFKTAGYYTSEFDASSLASGIYFYRITTADFSQVKKMLVVK